MLDDDLDEDEELAVDDFGAKGPQRRDYLDIKTLAQADPERARKATAFARRLQLLLLRGYYDAAKRLADEAQFEMEMRPDRLADRPLSDIGIPKSVCGLLEKNFDALTVEDLNRVKVSQIVATPYLGMGRVDEIWAKVLAAVAEGRNG